MRNSILGFSQSKLLEYSATSEYSVTMNDVLILDYVYHAVASPTMEHKIENDISYVWISHQKLIEDLPILNIGKDRIKRILSNLCTLNLLKSITVRREGKGSKSYYTITEECENLKYSNDEGVKITHHDDGTGGKNNPSDNKLLVTDKNKKSIISKDINTVQKSDSFLGSVKKPKQKQSLYSKAIGLINDFSDNQKIRDSLVDFLNLQLEIYKEQEKTFYINTFKNRLNKLRNEFSESDWLEVINYAVSRGWQNFYPIPTKNNFNTDGENESYYDDDYLEQQENWQREMARNGKETKF